MALTFPINNIESNTEITNIDLSYFHIHKLTLANDTALVFTNLPDAGLAIDWHLEVSQDHIGYHKLVWPHSVRHKPRMLKAPNKRRLFSCHTQDGGKTIHVMQISL